MSIFSVTLDDSLFEVDVRWTPNQDGPLTVFVDGHPVVVEIPQSESHFPTTGWLLLDNRPHVYTIDPDLKWLLTDKMLIPLDIRDQEAQVSRPPSGDKRIKAPIPGLIVRILVDPGAEVKTGDPILVLEAMKMENELRAPAHGIVDKLHVTTGQSVLKGEVLIEID